jgi:hypothetical protein
MLFEYFPSIVVLYVEASEIGETLLKAVLFDGGEQFIFE